MRWLGLGLLLAGLAGAQEMRGTLEVVLKDRGHCSKSLNCFNGLCGHHPGLLLQRREGAVRLWPGRGRTLDSLAGFHGRTVVVKLRPKPPLAPDPNLQQPQQVQRPVEYDILQIRGVDKKD